MSDDNIHCWVAHNCCCLICYSVFSLSLDGRIVVSDAKKQRQEANLGHRTSLADAVDKILPGSRFMTVLCPFVEWAQPLWTPFFFFFFHFRCKKQFLKFWQQFAEENDDEMKTDFAPERFSWAHPLQQQQQQCSCCTLWKDRVQNG